MTKKKKIFVSHSSDDKGIVDLMVSLLTSNSDFDCKYELKYSSSDNDNYRFKKGEDIGIKSIESSNDCDIFIAYISNSYKKSGICMNELGCGFGRFLKGDKKFKFLPFKDDYVLFNDLPLMLNNKIVETSRYEDIEKSFEGVFGKNFINEDKEVAKEIKAKYNGKDYNLEISKQYMTEYVLGTFMCTSLLNDKPYVQYIGRKLYNELHIDLTKFADEHLIWSAYKSPLLVEKHLLEEGYLTKYDKIFRKTHSRNKKRLVIFENKQEEDYFFQTNGDKTTEEKNRTSAFISANKDCLYYGDGCAIIKEYKIFLKNENKNEELEEIEAIDPEEELYLEFSYIKSILNTIEILIFSDYDNGVTHISNDSMPLFFLHPQDNHSNFGDNKKISNSFKINKFIVYWFDELCAKGIIKKYTENEKKNESIKSNCNIGSVFTNLFVQQKRQQ